MSDDDQNGSTETTETETSGGTTDAGGSTETGSDGTDNGGGTTEGGSGDGGSNGSDKGGDGDDELTRTKKHMRTWETRAGENKGRAEKAEKERDDANATLAAVRKAFGLDQDEDDPKKVAEQAQQTAAEKDRELRAMKVERAAERSARKAGADVDKLTDSRAFVDATAKLDPSADSFADDMGALVEKFLEDRPHFKAQPDTPPPSSQDMTGGGEGGKGGESTDSDDLDALSAKYAETHGR
ncbi:hypothetical protein [Pseudonocardia sp. McavD-2-B]|uniref:hypothetical protein n=1 Tax=Pseudonocardia sp. McavD-2-B TaxID=2954499 RepID=UPI00209833D9|nr:hypothetical protein [Pseudonocardia sp. McavD-2-B]MCO7195391.1 hypothetical protein [Pseudonocardia sp. McavD-2-B]